MPLTFCPNLNFLFLEQENLRDRYQAARDAGFTSVEFQNFYSTPIEELSQIAKDAGIGHELISAFPGNQSDDIGTAALPNRREDFKNDLELTIAYAKALNCTRVHVLSGRRPTQWLDDAMDEVYLENINYAADRFAQEGLTVLIEAINPRVISDYYMDSPTKALEVVQRVNKPNVRFQLDVYHIQVLEGDLTENIKKYLPYTSHIQVAQLPERNEIDAFGELNYQYILRLLEDLGYNEWIGLEYRPSANTLDSIKWIQEWGYA